ncbi:hypothetical protein SAMN05216462_1341 [Xylanibacter ruminicola]|uniref:Uncharacterized protein n=2 Tax=Xylanibacter ruminicola TaxID=839 RepID=A0A1H4ASE0_XYLRU|nr:hypothetical protein SAMN05216462_1341 [Xylanibacter ruminicola]
MHQQIVSKLTNIVLRTCWKVRNTKYDIEISQTAYLKSFVTSLKRICYHMRISNKIIRNLLIISMGSTFCGCTKNKRDEFKAYLFFFIQN